MINNIIFRFKHPIWNLVSKKTKIIIIIKMSQKLIVLQKKIKNQQFNRGHSQMFLKIKKSR